MKNLKYIVTGALAAALLAVPALTFTDTQGHWAEKDIIKWSQEYPILKGDLAGAFNPDAPVTRGAFAGILDRFFCYRYVSDPSVFTDIRGNYWETAVLKLHAADVYRGSGARAMADDTITRAQAVTMLCRAFQIETEETAASLPFTDADKIPDYARGAALALNKAGVISGDLAGRFNPDAPLTRAQLVSILSRMVDVLLTESDTYTKDMDGTVLLSAEEGAEFRDLHIGGDLIVSAGVLETVVLDHVTVEGKIINLGDAEIVTVEEQEAQRPPILPEDVYTPTKTTGETFIFRDKYEVPIYKDRQLLKIKERHLEWDGDRIEYTGSRYDARFGIDVSAYQNRATEEGIDWEAVADDGVDFAMVRIGFRGTGTGSLNADAYYAENIEGAMDAGIETGVYFFAQAITVEEAIEEAEFVLELLEGHEIDGPVAYDWEMHDSTYRVYGTPPEMATACAIAFCERIEEAGYDAMIYAGGYVSYLKYDQGAVGKYLSWYPEYKSEESESILPSFIYQMDYWQFSSKCTVDGINGYVDGNLHFY